MASFTLLVTRSPFDYQAAHSAYCFAVAAVGQGHRINGIFFYQSGVHNANSFQAGHSDEMNMYSNWQRLTDEHGILLQVCVTAANRRGIISQGDAQERDLTHYNLTSPFEEVGLGDLVSLMNQSDRTIQF